jgi:hypothetical protein
LRPINRAEVSAAKMTAVTAGDEEMVSKDTVKPDATPQEAAMADITQLQEQSLKALTGMNTAWLEALSDMGSEVMTFVAARIEEDVKAQHRMLHCRDAAELQKIQAEFIQKAINQYADESGKLAEMSRNVFVVPDSDEA